MNIIRKKYFNKDKQVPGILLETDDRDEVEISMITYTSDKSVKRNLDIAEFSKINLNSDDYHWIHCRSTSSNRLLEAVGGRFDIHPLLLENIQNVDQRPRLYDNEDFNFLVIKNYFYDDDKLYKRHIAIIIYDNLIITFSNKNNPFANVEERIVNNIGRIRKKGSDYLLFALLDVLLDDYFTVLDYLEQKAIHFEEILLERNAKFDNAEYIKLKKDIENIKRNTLPIPQMIEGLMNSNSPRIEADNIIYFKDISSSAIQISDTSQSMSSGIDNILNISINISGYQMNGIIKVLTIISTIFIPLTFIAGVYGMNFRYMPGLLSRYGFAVIMAGMAAIFLVMLVFFKKKKWF